MTSGVRRFSRYAPVSGERRPLLLTIASAYFMLSAVAIAFNVLLLTLFMPDILKGQSTPLQTGLGLAVTLLWAAGMFGTGSLLADKSRRGAYYALAFIGFSLVASFNLPRVIFSVASLAVLAAIWKHLE